MARSSNALMMIALVLLLACQIGSMEVKEITPWGGTGWSIAANHTFESHDEFLQNLRDKLATRYRVRNNPIMDRQSRFRHEPARWMLLNISGWDNNRTVLATRSDNGYLVGFQTRSGTWYALRGHQHLIPGSIPLSFGDSYADFFGIRFEAYKKLATLILGQASFLQAVEIFSEFDPNVPGSEDQLRRSFALMSLMVCESVRLQPIRKRVISTWSGQGQISVTMARLTVNWGAMSHRLMCWDNNYTWVSQTAKNIAHEVYVYSARQALQTVDLILWPTAFKPQNLEASCYDPVLNNN